MKPFRWLFNLLPKPVQRWLIRWLPSDGEMDES